MAGIVDKGGMPKRTREHRIADLSAHHVEGFVLRRGYTVEGFRHDYGYDLALFTYDYGGGQGAGEYEPDSVKIQLKATDHLEVLADGSTIAYRKVKRGHFNLWCSELMPVILIVYDAMREVAYWLHVQEYAKGDDFRRDAMNDTVTVRIPGTNLVNEEAIEAFRRLKRERHAYLRGLEQQS